MEMHIIIPIVFLFSFLYFHYTVSVQAISLKSVCDTIGKAYDWEERAEHMTVLSWHICQKMPVQRHAPRQPRFLCLNLSANLEWEWLCEIVLHKGGKKRRWKNVANTPTNPLSAIRFIAYTSYILVNSKWYSIIIVANRYNVYKPQFCICSSVMP